MHFIFFLGSARESSPPRPIRLGKHICAASERFFKLRYPEHTIEIIDVLDYELANVFKPEFSYSSQTKPTELAELAQKIALADGYFMISPEYNHSMSPALANLLNHFGSSLFAYKPSGIVTYSAGQWGGTRAAVNMRTFLSELGCLPVYAMTHVPKAQEVFDQQGNVISGDESNWLHYFNRTFSQLVWWAEAASKHKRVTDPHRQIENFKSNPSQRNAP